MLRYGCRAGVGGSFEEDPLSSDFLDSLVETYKIDTVTEHYKRLEFLDKLAQHVRLQGAACMELGCASGLLTEMLADACGKVTAVDGSERFLNMTRERVGSKPVTCVLSMFEVLPDLGPFDLVVLHHVLEHIDDPVGVLARAASLLEPGGVVGITVPNANALSRQLAVKMGLLKSVHELTPNDHHHGHRRVYDWSTLEEDVGRAGCRVIGRHGLAFILFADFQNEAMVKHAIIGDTQLRALWSLADEYREVSGAIMVVARRAR